jgi:prepilin-type N-terminal cleavage/methylation domain-containing protein
MKLFPVRFPPLRTRTARSPAQGSHGLTLVEMMITMSVFTLVLAGLLTLHIYGLKQNQLVESKLGASDNSRRALDALTTEIRSAKIWAIGVGDETSFVPIPNGTLQQGSALQFSYTPDTNRYIRYYFETNHGRLCRLASDGAGRRVIADHLTNNMFFRAEDYLGNVKTDLSYKYVIRVLLEFRQYQFPLTRVGPGYLYDYYKLDFRVTPHCPDGA